MRILISAPYFVPVYPQYAAWFEAAGLQVELAEVQERLSEEQLIPHAGGIDGTICGDDKYTRRVLELAAPRLRVISKWGTGIDSIDLEAAEQLGIRVFNTPGAFTDPVADSVMSYLLNFARGTPWLDRDLKAGGWQKLPAVSLKERCLGVVGVGRIGRAVLIRAAAFGMRLLGNDIQPIDPQFVESVGVSMVGLEQLLRESDFISLNCDLNPSSHHLIEAEKLARLKPGAVLINTSRGPVIDEPALISALRRGALAGAGLDVFEEEPLPPDSPLRSMDNVLLAPHNANASPAAWEHVHWNTLVNLFKGLGLEPPKPNRSPGEG